MTRPATIQVLAHEGGVRREIKEGWSPVNNSLLECAPLLRGDVVLGLERSSNSLGDVMELKVVERTVQMRGLVGGGVEEGEPAFSCVLISLPQLLACRSSGDGLVFLFDRGGVPSLLGCSMEPLKPIFLFDRGGVPSLLGCSMVPLKSEGGFAALQSISRTRSIASPSFFIPLQKHNKESLK